jgi:hypothetical protein
MKKKKIISGVLAATIVLGAAFSGCTLVSTMNENDMKQVIATVDITKASENLAKDGLADYATAISSKNIIKRDLVSAFVNVGYSYVQNGSSYSDVFTSLVNTLTSNAVITQYATLYMLKDKATNTNSDYGYDANALTEFISKSTTVEKYEYLLGTTYNGSTRVDSDGVKLAQYNLYSTINASLDSIEESILSPEDSTSGTDTRTTPTNVDTENDNYFPKDSEGNLNYGIYTGYGKYLRSASWDYEEVEGTTNNSRRKAYNSFITTLKTNYLITDEDTDTTDVMSIAYIQEEYVSHLQQIVINDFYDLFEKEQTEKINDVDSASGIYTFLQSSYEKLLGEQEDSYSTISSFETALDNASDTSFVLYSPNTQGNTVDDNGDGLGDGTYGYVYNILLPYDAKQTALLSEYSNYLSNGVFDDDAYYNARKALLKDIKTTDQRSAWFNGETDYSFNAEDSGLDYYTGGSSSRTYLFFENNLLKTDKYKSLTNYAGMYTYNGTVNKNTDGTYALTPNKLDIDQMLEEFVSYVNFVTNGTGSYELNDDYNTTTYTKADGSIDYSKFVYATGKINFTADRNNMFVTEGTSAAQGLALSAVNELQYAYTTDTGILSNYIGYSVSTYSTSYIKEFEYAAQTAIKGGAGTFTVCAGDYGWHLIYVTDTFSTAGGATYSPTFNAERVNTTGTFENKFYSWIKDSLLSNETTNKQSIILQLFGGDTTVTTYEDTYKDLLELDDD